MANHALLISSILPPGHPGWDDKDNIASKMFTKEGTEKIIEMQKLKDFPTYEQF